MDIHELESKIHSMVDDLQGLCSTVGLSNTANEEVVVTSVFLYKFLNDKFMYNLGKFSEEIDVPVESILKNEDDMLDAFYEYNSKDVAFSYEDTIQYLINHIEQQDFYKQFDDALVRISKNVKNEAFAVETADGEKTDLFEPLTVMVESAQRNNFAKAIFGIIAKDKFDFSEAFGGSFDFYSAIFEYLIKDYNTAGGGKYAEYYTPHAIATIMARLLVGDHPDLHSMECYDPSAGTGTLLMALSHQIGENRCTIFSQDISQRSNKMLKLNLLLNGLVSSLDNAIQGDTLVNPYHKSDDGQQLRQFDFVVSNPPFKIDFSDTREKIAAMPVRFWAGVPKVPAKKKESMAIYTCFIQHVINSLKPTGKGAIVIPTGFITSKSGVEKKILQKIVDDKIVYGCVSMPSNVFANTGTNVSVLFFDKSATVDKVILIDASKLGEEYKDANGLKKVRLNPAEIDKVVTTFQQKQAVEDFSVAVSYDEIKEKGYSLSAGQYFEIKIDYVDITEEEFNRRMEEYKQTLAKQFDESHRLESEIMKQLDALHFNPIKANE